jgi:hypothetical protein
MGNILVRTDAFIQRHFDACVHWVMLTFGVTKGFVRYSIGAFGVMCLAGMAVTSDRYGWAFAVLGPISLLLVETTKRQDDAAESAGMRSSSDCLTFVPELAARTLFAVGVVGWLVLLVIAARITPFDAFGVASTISHLAIQYIRRTSPRPPEKRQQVLVRQMEGV